MSKITVHCEKAPKAIGPYSHANIAGNLVFVSGQLPVKDGVLEKEDISKATGYCMENIASILESAGSSLAEAVKLTIYLTDMKQFSLVNEAYGKFFEGNYPSRVCIEVAALPQGVSVEIDCIAVKK